MVSSAQGDQEAAVGHHGHYISQWKRLDAQWKTDNSDLLVAQDDQIQPINEQVEGKHVIHKMRQEGWCSEIQ